MTELRSTLVELPRVLRVLPMVEWGRWRQGPAPLLDSLRRRGRQCSARNLEQRQCLRRAIRFVDARFPDGGNCFRRALLEVALDSVAAKETLHMAVREHGGAGSGHAWLGDLPDTNETYDAVFVA